MFLKLVVALALFASASADGTLHAVLAEKLKHYGDVEELKTQLSLILDGSRELLETREAVQGSTDTTRPLRQLHAHRPGASFDDVLAVTSKSLEVMERVAESHPIQAILARRTFLACIALQWIIMGQRPPGKEIERKLAQITSEFYRLHVTSVLRRGLLEYLHISKSGGTSFSAAAKHAKCAMAPGIGQLEDLGDLPRWINGTAFEELTDGNDIMWSFYSRKGRPAEGQTCSRRLAHLAAAGYAYVSNEFTLHGGGGSGGSMHSTHVCLQVVNVVTLRNPAGRLPSHLHYMLARVKKRLLARADFDPADFFDAFCSGDVRVWERVAPTVIDNYGVRSFVGEREFHAPVGGIGQQHVDVARRVLLQFDLVLDLDAGEEAGDLAIQQGLGWNVSMAELHVRSSSQTFSKLNYSKEDCPNDELLRTLLPRQEPDRLLYSTGRTLAFLDGVFLGVARALGLRPNDLAADADAYAMPAAARKASTAKASGDPECGLLHAAAVRGRPKAARGGAASRQARLLRSVPLLR